jgi:hypothetical protein
MTIYVYCSIDEFWGDGDHGSATTEHITTLPALNFKLDEAPD